MFTGIIQHTAAVRSHQTEGDSLMLTIEQPQGWALHPGDSVAVDGVCLTVAETDGQQFMAELMPETLNKTSFGTVVPTRVNLERPLSLASLLDGHMVQGHVDTTGHITHIQAEGQSRTYTISFPSEYQNYLISKGSVTVDGISLTVVEADKHQFSVALVDYTVEHTTLSQKAVGDLVNLEFDMIAKYITKLIPQPETHHHA